MNRNDQEYLVQKIRTQYTEKEHTALDELKALDAEVKRPVNLFAYAFGITASLIFGTGMSLAMKVIGNAKKSGIFIGIIGLIMAGINYPLYQRLLGSRKDQYADRILALSNQIMNEQSSEEKYCEDTCCCECEGEN